MKKIIYFLLISCLFIACNDEKEESGTSFIINLNDGYSKDLINVMTAYFDSNGKCILIGKHGNLEPFVPSKTFYMKEYHPEIYIFFENNGGSWITEPFSIRSDIKNRLQINENSAIERIPNKTEYNWPAD